MRVSRLALLCTGPLAVCGGLWAQIDLTRVTAEAGLTSPHVANQSIYGLQHWMVGGVAVGDFDRDGDPDVFFLSGGTARDRLFVNDGAATFTEQGAAWGLETHCGVGAAVGDYDGDGWLDVFVTSYGTVPSAGPGQNRLYRNNGNNTFTNVAAAAGVSVASATHAGSFGPGWGDYDLDGDLDLFVATWAFAAQGNRLYRNDGDGTFTDVTGVALGTNAMNTWGFTPAFHDMDGDGWPELLLAADYETSHYFVNDKDGTFTELTALSGTGLDDNGMGATIADFDNDGRFDWYVTSVHSAIPPPGNNSGNMHYRNLGGHLYEEISLAAGTNDGGWGWGVHAADLDNDGWLDMVELNGAGPYFGGGPKSEWYQEPGKLYRNDGDGTFTEVGAPSGYVSASEGRGVVTLDADRDGDLDVLAFTNGGPLEYYRNETPFAGHWLELRLDTSGNALVAPDGFGALVTATCGTQTMRRYVNGSPSYLSTGELLVHLGLGSAGLVDELRIDWPRGYVTVMANIVPDVRMVVACPARGDLDSSGALDLADLELMAAHWGAVTTLDGKRCDLTLDGRVGVADVQAWVEENGAYPVVIYGDGSTLRITLPGERPVVVPGAPQEVQITMAG